MVVIVSANQFEGKKIFESLSQVDTSEYRLEFEFLRPTQIPDQLDPSVDLIVYNNNTNMNMNIYQQISAWRKKGCLSSVLLLSKMADDSLMSNTSTNNLVILEKPYLERDLCGITEKLLNVGKINQRKFRRYDVQQSVSLSSYKSGFNVADTSVRNMSRGGLCIAGPLDGLKEGDLLRVDFHLEKINARRAVNGKVVWVAKENEEVQAGLEFVKDADVYCHLLSDIG